MAGEYRVTFLFQQYKNGWSETLFLPSSTASIAAANSLAGALSQLRKKLLGRQGRLLGYRISVEGVFRDGYTSLYPADQLKGVQTEQSDFVDTALMVTCLNALVTRQKKIYLRGIWDSVVDTGGDYSPTPTFSNNITAYEGAVGGGGLVGGGWGWMGNGTPTKANLLACTQNADGTVQLQFASDLLPMLPNPVPNYSIRLSGVQGAKSVNGQLVVTPLTRATMKTKNRIPIFAYTTGGVGQYASKIFIPIAGLGVNPRIVERKAGRNFFVSPGRRSAKRVG